LGSTLRPSCLAKEKCPPFAPWPHYNYPRHRKTTHPLGSRSLARTHWPWTTLNHAGCTNGLMNRRLSIQTSGAVSIISLVRGNWNSCAHCKILLVSTIGAGIFVIPAAGSREVLGPACATRICLLCDRDGCCSLLVSPSPVAAWSLTGPVFYAYVERSRLVVTVRAFSSSPACFILIFLTASGAVCWRVRECGPSRLQLRLVVPFLAAPLMRIIVMLRRLRLSCTNQHPPACAKGGRCSPTVINRSETFLPPCCCSFCRGNIFYSPAETWPGGGWPGSKSLGDAVYPC